MHISYDLRKLVSIAAACLAGMLGTGCSDSTAELKSAFAPISVRGAVSPPGAIESKPETAAAKRYGQVTVSYDLVIFNQRAVVQDMDRMEPRQGKGYQPLEAFVYVRGVPRARSPVASVKPVCASTTRCEYLPPRKGGYADRYVITLDGDSVAQLSANEDVVVISARNLALPTVATVNVTLEIPGEKPLTKHIVYGPPLS